MRPGRGAALLVCTSLGLTLGGCTRELVDRPSTPAAAEGSATSAGPSSVSATPVPTPPSRPRSTPQPNASASARRAGFDAGRAYGDIRRLAGDIGPREAASRSFAEAADLVAERFTDLGYDVRRTQVRVPAGSSWGTPVRRGRSQNVIAEPPGFDPTEEHVVVGAHLDTVPVAPGAEDNASGVAVLLELARLASLQPPQVPVQLIAFGAEEPRGPGDANHHFGSQQLVGRLSPAERRSIVGMVALDRVGVRAGYVPVCRGGADGTSLRTALREAGRRAEVTTRPCQNTTSDHWSYEKAGVPAARIGSVPYAGYHSRRDVVSVIDRRQLDRVGRLMWTWLSWPG
jgi:Zn-dependent M28 family amino/carboxypeptidase